MTASGSTLSRSSDTCRTKSAGCLCALDGVVRRAFDAVKIPRTIPKNSRLYSEGQPAVGVHIICSGRIKLYAHSTAGKALVFRVALPGEILGLNATLGGEPHAATARAVEDCHVNFVAGQDFLDLIRGHSEIAFHVLQELSRSNRKLETQFRSFGFAASATEKLAKLILEWCNSDPEVNGHAKFRRSYTHEEIAEMIGTTRETVTRIFARLKGDGLIVSEGPLLFVPDTQRLRYAAGLGRPDPGSPKGPEL